ncbi:MAG: hypothetical protein COW24_05430 [Candidatus Kerfeldbacteria bacterium CG15_BIG_FIL_POST_REV_8_21_14_020_45_12]|uniref:histidine kinase n=1 Tax=Candidatus Kerfeldbacteria bacterium CG15_BIG_FIL_POST_REV_8_21_14_020_45_12 TaxID=2014247 RepID=A0A2M7H2I3_9BACT|nr:MAG: hypothetical protein COW24_05430 [Candidatus Kerfeldbacteria bacterium CG15_BIG_FIL_POST_REV_8_21_14_020_45_12]PJA93406.1 MAG: hypothetical protein CO132_03555 [Candidatus Kerfeldbacteria bacterium CG_4_9_14_3_um_filter_45_8]
MVAERDDGNDQSLNPEKDDSVSDGHLQKINEELYKRNFELAVKNKTLGLLRTLYEISTGTLEPEELSRQLTHEIRDALGLSVVSIFAVDIDGLYLYPIGLSVSNEIRESFSKIEDDFSLLHLQLAEDPITNLVVKVVRTGQANRDTNLSDLFIPYLNQKEVDKVRKEAGLQSFVVFPLIISGRPIGALVLSLDKKYSDLNSFTRESIESLVNVVAVAVDRAFIYVKLKFANSHLQELDKAKSEFMSIASHQLRTPLAGIMGYLSMIDAGDYGKTNPEQAPIIHDVLDATQRLIRMVNVFLNVTRIEAGRFVMNFTKVSFNTMIEDVYKVLKPTADKKGVKLTFKSIKTLPEVEVDADKIKDVILNFTDNAIKYSPEGKVEVWGEATKKTVIFHCKDTGVGIAKTEVDNLFAKFVRGSGIAQVDPSGSGLGLFIAKKVTEGHGGRVWAESPGEGKGSTFSFEIPIKADPEAKKNTEEFIARATKK